MKTLVKAGPLIVLLMVTFAGGWLVARTGMGATLSSVSVSDRERQFIDRMNGSSLVGRFTLEGREDRPAAAERYDIASVEKVDDTLWRFNARMRYGSVDTTLPMLIPVQWVGETPMITMTDYSIPTLGTFSVRLLFHGDRYAGSWQHGAYGGLMYGRIEKQSDSAKPSAQP